MDLGPYTDALPAAHPINAARFIRFVQWGAFSAIFRPHDGGNADSRIWTFAPEHYNILRDYTRLRGALTPWIYAMAAKTRDESIPFSRPMWWDYGADAAASGEDAHAMSEQFVFGDGVIVRPISKFISPQASMPPFNDSSVAVNSSAFSVWLPSGCWLSWNASGAPVCGPVRHSGVAHLGEIPLFVRPGTVLPMWPPGRRTADKPPAMRTRLWTLFVGGGATNGTGVDHEDDGETLALASTKTTLRFAAGAKGVEVKISHPIGSYAGMSRSKTHAVQLRGFQLGGRAVSCCAGGAACAPLARGTVGDFSAAGFWTQPATAAEMAVTAGALVVVRPLRRLLVWCVRLLRLTSMALFRSAPPRMRRRGCGWWWLDWSA